MLASQPGASRSKVLEDALRQMVEGSASQTLLERVHRRLDEMTAAPDWLGRTGHLRRGIASDGGRREERHGVSGTLKAVVRHTLP